MIQFITLIALALSQPVFAQFNNTIYACYSGGQIWDCQNAPRSPYVGSSNPELNDIYMNSRRYGAPTYNDMRRFQERFNKVPQPAPHDIAAKQAYEHFQTQIAPFMNVNTGALPSAPGDVKTPFPADVDPAMLERRLDPLWKAVSDSKANPLAAAREISSLYSQIQKAPASEAKYLTGELTRNFVDHRGVMRGLPFAEAPKASLATRALSEEGQRVRTNLNALLASESIVGVRCASASAESCGAFSVFVEELKAAQLLGDRLGSLGNQSEFSRFMDAIDPAVRFAEGLSQGLVDGVHDLQSLGQALLRHGLMTIYDPVLAQKAAWGMAVSAATAIYDGVSDIAGLWNKVTAAVSDKYETMLSGTAEQRGKIVGEATWQVATAIGGEALAAKLAGGALLPKAMDLAATRAASEIATDAAEKAGLLVANEARGVRAMAKLEPHMAGEIVSSTKPFLEPSRTWLAKVGETDLVTATRASRGDLFGSSKVGQPFNHHIVKGPLIEDSNGALAFMGQTYWEVEPKAGEVFYRVGGSNGTWWSRVEPKSQMQVMIDNAVLPQWNDFSQVSKVVIPEGGIGKFYEGLSGSQGGALINPRRPELGHASNVFVGGKGQVYIPNEILSDPRFQRMTTTNPLKPR